MTMIMTTDPVSIAGRMLAGALVVLGVGCAGDQHQLSHAHLQGL